MLTLFAGTVHEATVRVFLESKVHGREYFDSYDSLDECLAAVAQLAHAALIERDRFSRRIGLVLVPSNTRRSRRCPSHSPSKS
jgi:hypothetical protein